MNLSETAFVRCISDGGDLDSTSKDEFSRSSKFELRWFTPKIEVPLCGHATLATAAAIANECGNMSEKLIFETKSGTLVVRRDGPSFSMTLPFLPPQSNLPSVDFDLSKSKDLFGALFSGVCTSTSDLKSMIRDVRYEPTLRYLVISLVDEGDQGRKVLESLQPDSGAMQSSHRSDMLVGVIVTTCSNSYQEETCESNDHIDAYSRFFGPWAGIQEDPVTGSAHSVLGP